MTVFVATCTHTAIPRGFGKALTSAFALIGLLGGEDSNPQ